MRQPAQKEAVFYKFAPGPKCHVVTQVCFLQVVLLGLDVSSYRV